ncbi:MAG: DUF1553 domain-containing protein [Gammaproteobacteria bacterium]|nr:DUF1553 domain-containing protein [Gammaproteobacteria bacterium]
MATVRWNTVKWRFERAGTRALLVTIATWVTLTGCTESTAPGESVAVNYNWDVRPILSDNCFQCHGHDEEGRKAGLRLDVRELATAQLPESPGRHAIVPGDATASELIKRITASNPDDRMPPASTHKVLSARQIDTLRAWIDQGAEYLPHWAFVPPGVSRPPGSDANPIDAFIGARLTELGLARSAPASREALINRVYLTTTGLPPSIEEVDAFVADTRPDAWERLVDRLLASERYAEHMAGYWMDLARWSETDGFLDDHHDRFLWPWRDWVIKAFADNMPFDQFGTWQLAGDLLPDATREQVLATAFLRVGKRTTENGAIEAEYKAEYMIERTDNALGTAFMGLTLGCARCHDHKYDPISQREYYALGAFFNSTDEPGTYSPGFSGIQGGPTLAWPDESTASEIVRAAENVDERLAAVNAARSAVESAQDASAPDVEQLTAELRQASAASLTAYYPFDEVSRISAEQLPPGRVPRIPPAVIYQLGSGPYIAPPPMGETAAQKSTRERQEYLTRVQRGYNFDELYLSPSATPGVDGAVLQDAQIRPGVVGNAVFFNETNKGFLAREVGNFDRSNPFTLDFWFYAAERYDDVPVLNYLAEQNSGRTGYRFAINDGRLWVSLAHSPPANMIALLTTTEFPIGRWTHVTLTYDGSSRAAGTLLYVDGAPAAVEVVRDSLTRSMRPWNTGDVFDPFYGLAFGTRFREKAPVGSGLDELRTFDRPLLPVEVALLHDPAALAKIDADTVREQRNALRIARDPQVVAANAALMAAREQHDKLVTSVPQVLVMGDAPHPIPTHVLNRGVYSAPGAEVQPEGLPSVMPWNDTLPRNRLGLAQWLFDPANPLTARVFVNRIWQLHFGRGIVESAEDFGSQGSVPSHPELLDWLTVKFVESGWDIKALHRLIVTSATYQQDSAVSESLAARDPTNELYARGPRWRMTAEMVRDHALAVAGLLTDDIGGPSATPYQPDDIWNPLNAFYRYPAAAELDPAMHHRRTLYTVVKRNATHPALKIFDFGTRTESLARRRSSNTPLQALVLLNDPQFVEAYRKLAERVLQTSGDDSVRLRRLYRMVTRLTPGEQQVDILQRFLTRERSLMQSDANKVNAILTTGVTPADTAFDAPDLAAMTEVAALVMNSPDAYTVR